MKNIFSISILLILVTWLGGSRILAQSSTKLTEFCAASAGDDATYLKDFVVELDAAACETARTALYNGIK